MKLADFNYTYPEHLVAQRPLKRRDASRMMVINRLEKTFEHSSVKNFPDFLNAGDLVVINNSRVFPARLFGKRESGSKVEILLLKEMKTKEMIWSAIATRKKRLKEGEILFFDGDLTARILKNDYDELILKFFTDRDFYEMIEKTGLPPLPPYIKRGNAEDYTEEDRKRYQTVYAKHIGSAAAPTAGFHITKEILERCRNKGARIAEVTLHVGLDTFSPVRTEDIKDHKMHGERFFVSEDVIRNIEKTKKAGGRVVAIGTTTVRALESALSAGAETLNQSKEKKPSGEPDHFAFQARNNGTHLFIFPGYKFKIVDAILTNFHQPMSTLLMMISAFAGKEFILEMYKEAIEKRYRLFSYGDCMLLF